MGKTIKLIALLLMIVFAACKSEWSQGDITKWAYIEVDSTRGIWGDFGLAIANINKKNVLDIVSGRYRYQNPVW